VHALSGAQKDSIKKIKNKKAGAEKKNNLALEMRTYARSALAAALV
jgi:hypothetical protein